MRFSLSSGERAGVRGKELLLIALSVNWAIRCNPIGDMRSQFSEHGIPP